MMIFRGVSTQLKPIYQGYSNTLHVFGPSGQAEEGVRKANLIRQKMICSLEGVKVIRQAEELLYEKGVCPISSSYYINFTKLLSIYAEILT